MPNLKEVRIRIDSVKNTQQITNAMKMVAASKLRKAQHAIQSLRPYAGKMQDILANLKAGQPEGKNLPYSQERPPEKILVFALASNRGLCGAFNTNVIRNLKNLVEDTYAEQHAKSNLFLITAGKHLGDHCERKGYPLLSRKDELIEKISFEGVSALASDIMNRFEKGEFDKVYLVYNQFRNAAMQVLVTETFLPISQAGALPAKPLEYIYQPGREEILNEIIDKSLHLQLYKAFLDSYASEQGARMTAMHKATDNAGELLKELKLSYNKARQAAITKEILEIVSGANALKGQ